MNRCAMETELLAEPALQEAEVTRFQMARSKQHEGRRTGAGLSPEQDARLLAATYRVWVRRNEPAQECI